MQPVVTVLQPLLVVDTGGRVHAKAGTRQSVVCRSLTAAAGRYFMAAASLPGVQTHGGSGCETSKRSVAQFTKYLTIYHRIISNLL